MIIKKFTAETEQEAVMQAKEEMGSNAIVLNIKTIKQRGIRKFFKKDIVEVTAALEEKTTASIPIEKISLALGKEDLEQRVAIEEKLDNLQTMLEQRISDNTKKSLASDVKVEKNVNHTFMQLIYNQLIENEVDEKYVNQIISEIESSLRKENTLDTILASVYQKIVLKLGLPDPIILQEKNPQIVFFIGPTGVGKTTTIAKIASDFKINKNAKVALITSDTYRIAAVEQLRTYANILNVSLSVVYTVEELNNEIASYKDYDLILVDTAGRSHKNKEQYQEIEHFVNDCIIPEEFTKKMYLVLSATSKYRDLKNIVDVYDQVGKYSLIFTKTDETTALGNVFNIRLKTNADLSYITGGQTVPDDISIIDPQMLAKSLLGGGE
ncbi:MAG: flagellar biosynthesis protein FlhF [Lachnospiraceae bacterium]|nr:flagellar biosynthesis protein FlhF [Lachnospiraceae bacterium]